jgi:hypothetical protein
LEVIEIISSFHPHPMVGKEGRKEMDERRWMKGVVIMLAMESGFTEVGWWREDYDYYCPVTLG